MGDEGIYCEVVRQEKLSIQGQGKPRSRLNSKVHIEQLFKHCSNIKRSMSLETLFDSLRNILNFSVPLNKAQSRSNNAVSAPSACLPATEKCLHDSTSQPI
jgi:hypothetical protein